MRPPIDSGTVLITGASSGVGREIARQLAYRARTLVLVARSEDRLETLRDELFARNPTLGVVVEQCDLAQPEDVDALLDSLRRNLIHVDVLVNCAGLGDYGLYERESWSRIHQMMRVNLTAPLLLAHRLVRGMVERKRGGILTVGAAGSNSFAPGMAVYCATRRFLDGFTESLRLELLGTGVVVTQVSPGAVDTRVDEQAGAEDQVAPPPAWMRISAARCAFEAIAAFERGLPRVHPGLMHRWMTRLSAILPRRVRRASGLGAARRLRHGAPELEPALHPQPALDLAFAPVPEAR